LCYTNHQVQIIVERNEDECCIHVDDDGPGIPPADRQRVFEPFVRLDASRSRMSGGYGLGLAIVSRILEWHDGRIAVTDSQLGGARFSVCWPGYR
jgi:signal transduction histidine kinase